MSKWIEQREAFYKIAVARGMTREEEIKEAFPLGSSLPPGKMEKWLRRFIQLPGEFSSQRRYVNRFKLGADPEFVFTVVGKDQARKDASQFKLKQGPAFGADNNGRLAEIRPYPSRSALEVCASVLATLRWMAVLYPHTLGYDWRAGAWQIEDGLGGHVHFGRKRPGRKQEVAALDVIEESMIEAGLFDRFEQSRRREGDSHRQLYGQLGDYRLQAHGYEYRTFPSWLDSPELAFLTITLSKLGVHDPGVIWKYVSGQENFLRLTNLLRYYKECDDDARLALVMLKDLALARGGDFKGRWGISVLGKEGVRSSSLPQIIPLSIKPTDKDIAELFDHFAKKTPLVMRVPEPTWSPTEPPRGYRMLIDSTQTIGKKGLGEMCWDMCYHENYPIGLVREATARTSWVRPITIPRQMWETLPKNPFESHGSDNGLIYINPTAIDKGRSGELRRQLLSGLLPIWKVKDVRASSYEQWKTHVQKPKQPRRYIGSFIREEGKLPGIRYY